MVCGWIIRSMWYKCYVEDFGFYFEGSGMLLNIFKQKVIGYYLYFKFGSNIILDQKGFGSKIERKICQQIIVIIQIRDDTI